MDKQLFVDRLLETENLTDQLEDSEAKWLLNWGISQLDTLIAGCADEEAAGEKVNGLMSVMRQINRLVARKDTRPPEALADDLQNLLQTYAEAFGAAGKKGNDEPPPSGWKAGLEQFSQRWLGFLKPGADTDGKGDSVAASNAIADSNAIAASNLIAATVNRLIPLTSMESVQFLVKFCQR